MQRILLILLVVSTGACFTCRDDGEGSSYRQFSCETHVDCIAPFQCADGVCRPASAITRCVDADGDGFGIGDEDARLDCPKCENEGRCEEDCNDEDASIAPDLLDVCDGVDNNCNGEIDEPIMCDSAADCPSDDPLIPACDGVCEYYTPLSALSGCEQAVACVGGQREMLGSECY